MNQFDDIRPYHDSEVQPVLKKLISDPEFLDLIGVLRFSGWYTAFRFVFRPLLKWRLMSHMADINSITDFQLVVEKYLIKMIHTTTSEFTVEGLDKLDPTQNYLFMSNHRDITLDPAFTNYALYHALGSTLRIAIGDNLLSKPFASDLMRLNKSFIVRRSISKPRELLSALKKLSSYIWHSLKVDHEHIWIAHREGRAKDGMDKTDPAIIKMLTIAKPKDIVFADYITSLQIVPVSIAYEYDPCDIDKARELRLMTENQEYVKAKYEDLTAIGKGISGNKGCVHLSFGQPLKGEFNDVEDVARMLDQSIMNQYKLHATNVLAFNRIFGKEKWEEAKKLIFENNTDVAFPEIDSLAEKIFVERMNTVPLEEQKNVLSMYANPILHKLELIQ